LYKIAKRIDMRRLTTDSISKALKRQIDENLAAAAPSFKAMMKRKNLTLKDLNMIAAHDTFPNRWFDLTEFLTDYTGKYRLSSNDFKQFFNSQALKAGFLPRIKNCININIGTKQDVLRYIRTRGGKVSFDEMDAVLTCLAPKQGKHFLKLLETEDRVMKRNGDWIA